MLQNYQKYLIVGLTIILALSNLFAGDYIGKQRTISFDEEALMALVPSAMESADANKIAEAVFALTPDEILGKLKAAGITPQIMEADFYISGNKFRMDASDPEMGKVSVIMLPEKDMMYMIQWPRNQYTCMSIKEMGEMNKKMEDMSSQYMKGLPKEAQEALKQYQGMGNETEEKSGKLEGPKGSATINNFSCKEYSIDAGTKKVQMFVTDKYPDLAKTYKYFMEVMPAGKDDKNDPDRLVLEQVSGVWPVLTKAVEINMMRGQASVNIDEMVSMKPGDVPADKYEIPANLTEAKMPMGPGMEGK